MTNSTKFSLFIALSFLGIWTCKHLQPKRPVDEIIVANIHIDRQPCISAMGELFGKGVDSSKLCNCLIPQFYELIKKDSTLVEQFKLSPGFFTLKGSMQDSLSSLLASCVKQNILDTNAIFILTPEFQSALKNKLKKKIEEKNLDGRIDPDKFSNCFIEKLNGDITIRDYFSDDYFEVPKLKKIIIECTKQSTPSQ
jgi:hypothetical protein